MANTVSTSLQNREIQTAILFEKDTNRLVLGRFSIAEKNLRSPLNKSIILKRAKSLYHLTRSEVMALPMGGYRASEARTTKKTQSPWSQRRDIDGVHPITRIYHERDVEAAALKKFGGVRRFVNFLVNKMRRWKSLSGKSFKRYPKSYKQSLLEAWKKDQERDVLLKAKWQRTIAGKTLPDASPAEAENVTTGPLDATVGEMAESDSWTARRDD